MYLPNCQEQRIQGKRMRQDDVDYLNRESTQRVTTKLIMDKAKYKSLFQLLLLNVQQTI